MPVTRVNHVLASPRRQSLTSSGRDVGESCGQSACESSRPLVTQDDSEGVKEVVVLRHVLQSRTLELQSCLDGVRCEGGD